MSIKQTLLEKHFINAAVELAKIQMDEKMPQRDKDLRMNMIWKKFKGFIDENYDEK